MYVLRQKQDPTPLDMSSGLTRVQIMRMLFLFDHNPLVLLVDLRLMQLDLFSPRELVTRRARASISAPICSRPAGRNDSATNEW